MERLTHYIPMIINIFSSMYFYLKNRRLQDFVELYIYRALCKSNLQRLQMKESRTQTGQGNGFITMSHKNQVPNRLQESRDFLQEERSYLGVLVSLLLIAKVSLTTLKREFKLYEMTVSYLAHNTVLAQLVFWSGTYSQQFDTDYPPHTYRAAQQVKQVTIIFKCSL